MSMHVISMASLTHPRLDDFLLGYIAGTSAVVALYFLRFWKDTRDFLFFAFAVFFAVQGGTRTFAFSTASPNLVNTWSYLLRLLSILLVVAAIARKNTRRA